MEDNDVHLFDFSKEENAKITRILFAKTGVCLRAENDETELFPGYLTLIEAEWVDVEVDTEYMLTWIPSSSITNEQRPFLLDLAKRSRNATMLGKKPVKTAQPFNFPSNDVTDSISVPLSTVSHVSLSSELTLSQMNTSVCITKLNIYITLPPEHATSASAPADRGELQRFHDRDSYLKALGGAKIASLWFEYEDELKTLASSTGMGSIAPSVEEVVNELSYWLNAVGLGLNQSTVVPGIFFIGEYVAGLSRPVSPSASAKSNLMTFASGLGNIGYNIISAINAPAAISISNRLEDATFEVFNTFSQITRITKNTGSSVLEHRLTRPILPFVPEGFRDFFMTNAEATKLLNEYEGAGEYIKLLASEVGGKLGMNKKNTVEGIKRIVDKTRDFERLEEMLPDDVILFKNISNDPISAGQWISFFEDDVNGKIGIDESKLKEMIFARGVENDIRPIVWKYLLSFYPWDSNEEERTKISQDKQLEYLQLKAQWETIILEAGDDGASGMGNGPGGDEREDGDVVDKLRERKYRIEKDVVRTDRTEAFFQGKEQETNVPIDELTILPLTKNLEMLRDVLMTYASFNFELGYVQGMNDLLAPILVVMGVDSDAFWCFEKFMQRMGGNFLRDQSGMRKQLKKLEIMIRFIDPYLYAHLDATDSINLFCCFRWLLVLFKREFDFDSILRMWEVILSCPFTKHLHLFITFDILNHHRQNLFFKCQAFDETLKYINDLSGKMDIESILVRSETIFHVFKSKLSVVMKDKFNVDISTGASNTASPVFAAQTPGKEKEVNEDWSDAIDSLKLPEMTHEDLWELCDLLEN